MAAANSVDVPNRFSRTSEVRQMAAESMFGIGRKSVGPADSARELPRARAAEEVAREIRGEGGEGC